MSDEIKVSPSEAVNLIKHCMRVDAPVFLWGPPGIGKSDIVRQIGQSLNRAVIDVRLLLLDPTDLKGIPFYNPVEKTMEWAPPSELPAKVTQVDLDEEQKILEAMLNETEEGLSALQVKERSRSIANQRKAVKRVKQALMLQDAVLFLDELSAAPPSVQAASYQLVLDRRIGEYELPEKVSVIAAGNREGDKAVSYSMPTPLRNRFVHFTLTTNTNDWIEWAINNNVEPDVIGFISDKKQHLNNFDPKSPSKAFPTPRSWKRVSDLIKGVPAQEKDSFITTLVSGTVGDGVAAEFMTHRRYAAKLPKPEDALRGKVKDLKTKESSALYSLVVSMCYTLKEWYDTIGKDDSKYKTSDYNENMDHFFRFMLDNLEPEMTVLGVRIAINSYGLPINHSDLKHFGEFYKKYKDYILG